jgi:hypothetical protein
MASSGLAANYSLAKCEPAVIGRDLSVRQRLKAILCKCALSGPFKQQEVLKDAAERDSAILVRSRAILHAATMSAATAR